MKKMGTRLFLSMIFLLGLLLTSAQAQVNRIELDIAGYLWGFWVYNIKAAVSRLDFAPETQAMEVTDIATGHFVFSPLPEKKVSYRELDKAIVDAGYKIENAWIEVAGTLRTDTQVRVEETGQTFRLVGEKVGQLRTEVSTDSRVVVSGSWKTEQEADTLIVEKWSMGS